MGLSRLLSLQKTRKGDFVLVKTSNKSSGDLQDRMLAEEKMRNYELMAHLLESWGADEMGNPAIAVLEPLSARLILLKQNI